MSEILDILFSQYYQYEPLHIYLEVIAIIFGVLSVIFSKKNNILVFPTGMISTLIFVYLLFKWELLGDMMINGYYFIMSIYGWYIWTRKLNNTEETAISSTTSKEKTISILIFIGACIFVSIIYTLFNKWTNEHYIYTNTFLDDWKSWTACVDILTTGIFFVGMWLMAKRKIENWVFWIIGDVISVPLYFYKGYTFTSIQYLFFTFIAILGYLEWKKGLSKNL